MMVFLIILSCMLWIAALGTLGKRILLAPALSYCGLLVISFAMHNDLPVVPLSKSMLISWLCITLVMMLIIVLQNPAIRMQSRGTGYILVGGLAGMAVGLLAFTFTASLTFLYSLMLLGIIIGIFLGYLLFTRTPDGVAVAPGTGNFFRYLLAKGFPTLITLAQPGIVAVILIASTLPEHGAF